MSAWQAITVLQKYSPASNVAQLVKKWEHSRHQLVSLNRNTAEAAPFLISASCSAPKGGKMWEHRTPKCVPKMLMLHYIHTFTVKSNLGEAGSTKLENHIDFSL